MKLLFTGAQKESDSQTEPRLSTGGHISGSEVPNGSLNNLFGEISEYTLEKQVVEYRGVAYKNTTGVIVNGAQLYYENVSSNPLVNIRIAVVLPAQDNCGWYIERIPTIQSKPINATFVDNRRLANAIPLPDINSEEYIGVWIERSFNAAAISDSRTCEALIEAYRTGKQPQIATVETVADTTDSLNGTYWFLDTPNAKFMFWYNTGSGMMPTVSDREPIQIQINTGDTADDVATKTTGKINELLQPRGEAIATVGTNIVTVTNMYPGPSTAPSPETSGFTINVTQEGTSGDQEKIEDIALTVEW